MRIGCQRHSQLSFLTENSISGTMTGNQIKRPTNRRHMSEERSQTSIAQIEIHKYNIHRQRANTSLNHPI